MAGREGDQELARGKAVSAAAAASDTELTLLALGTV